MLGLLDERDRTIEGGVDSSRTRILAFVRCPANNADSMGSDTFKLEDCRSDLDELPSKRLSVDVADALAARLTGGRMRIENTRHGTFLVRSGGRGRVRLLAYQLTEEGIEHAIAEHGPWLDS